MSYQPVNTLLMLARVSLGLFGYTSGQPPAEKRAASPERRLVLGLHCDEGQGGRKAAGRETGRQVAGSELFGGGSVGGNKPAIGVVKLTTDLAAGGVNKGSGRFLRLLGTIVRVLAENGRNAERLSPGFGALRREFAFDLGDEGGGTLAPSGFG